MLLSAIRSLVQETLTSTPDKCTIETRSQRIHHPESHVENIDADYVLHSQAVSRLFLVCPRRRKRAPCLRPFKTAAQTFDNVK
jgi:hypothetical protein